ELVVTAIAPLPSIAPLPISVVPSRIRTVPVGVPCPGSVTCTPALSTSDAPTSDGFDDAAIVVVVDAGPTAAVAGGEAAAWKTASPANLATMSCVPSVSANGAVATPVGVSIVAVARTVVPSTKSIVPAGLPNPVNAGAIVADSVTTSRYTGDAGVTV